MPTEGMEGKSDILICYAGLFYFGVFFVGISRKVCFSPHLNYFPTLFLVYLNSSLGFINSLEFLSEGGKKERRVKKGCRRNCISIRFDESVRSGGARQ